MDKITLFTAVTAAAVVLQALVLVGILIALRKSSSRVEALAEEVRGKALPAIDTAQTIMNNSREKLDTILTNVQQTSTVVRGQVDRMDKTLNDVVDRARLQVIRADELITRTIDQVEEATDAVQQTVVSPVRQISGILQGVSVGVEAFLRGRSGRRRTGNGVGVPDDDMFI
jgi:methyl-accepting chemotaxis protein